MLYTMSSITEHEVTVEHLTFPSTFEVDLYKSQFGLTNVQAKNIYISTVVRENVNLVLDMCLNIA